MSIDLPDISLTLNTVSQINFPGNIAQNSIDWITLTNESPFAGIANIGGLPERMPAWYYLPVQLRKNGQSIVNTSGQNSFLPNLQTIPGAGFTTNLHVTLYFTGETPSNIFPGSLGGGPINLAIASSLVNTGNPPATPIVFAEPVGDTSANGAVNINNQGQMTLGDPTYNGSIAILGTDSANVSITRKEIAMFSAASNLDIDFQPGFVLLNGSTSGTAKLYQWMRGTLKILMVQLVNFRNGSAPAQTMSLPVNFLSRSVWRTTNSSPITVTSGGVGQNFGVITTWAAAGGSVTVQATLNKFSIADNINPIDTISFTGSQASAFDGLIIAEGI